MLISNEVFYMHDSHTEHHKMQIVVVRESNLVRRRVCADSPAQTGPLPPPPPCGAPDSPPACSRRFATLSASTSGRVGRRTGGRFFCRHCPETQRVTQAGYTGAAMLFATGRTASGPRPAVQRPLWLRPRWPGERRARPAGWGGSAVTPLKGKPLCLCCNLASVPRPVLRAKAAKIKSLLTVSVSDPTTQ